MPKVFVSYQRNDEEATLAIARDIRALGNEVWHDQELAGGQEWWGRILKSIRGCDLLLLVLSRHSLDSTASRRECAYATALGKPILPVLVGKGVSANSLPSELSKVQLVDFRERDADQVLELARALRSLPASSPLPEPLPEEPPIPVSYLNQIRERIESRETLSYEQQSAMFLDLRKALSEPEVAEEAQNLLKLFRSRADLLARVAEEIDQMETALPRRRVGRNFRFASLGELFRMGDGWPKLSGAPSNTNGIENDGETTLLRIIVGALLGPVIGFAFGIATWMTTAMVVSSIGGILAARLIGSRRNVLFGSLVGSIAGGLLALSLSKSVLVGYGIGAVFGAVLVRNRAILAWMLVAIALGLFWVTPKYYPFSEPMGILALLGAFLGAFPSLRWWCMSAIGFGAVALWAFFGFNPEAVETWISEAIENKMGIGDILLGLVILLTIGFGSSVLGRFILTRVRPGLEKRG